jgi:hypothetical protein
MNDLDCSLLQWFLSHLYSPVSALSSLDTKTIPAVKTYTSLTKKNKLFF